MAALPSPTQVAGTHSAIYEAYYHQVDPNGSGAIQAVDAARFLKKSRLSDVVLSKIWDLSEPTGRGYLDKAGLFVALKLVALAQAGKDINMSNIHSETPPPKLGELPKVPPAAVAPARPAAPATAGDWSMKPAEREKYGQLFDSLQPHNGLIAGNKVRGVLLESKLPMETLGKIWDLADQDKDGMLDRHEFMVAMHLVYKALEKHAVPTALPAELRARPARPPSRPPSRPASPCRPPPPRPAQPAHQTNAMLLEGLLDLSSPPSQTAPSLPAAPATASWVVTPSELARADAQFAVCDSDHDGLVSGLEIKQTLLESGLPQHTLAHIWALCDTASAGKLSREQFALALWLVRRAQTGEQPPAALPPHWVPPSCRPQPALPPPIPEPVSLGPQPTPELEAIAREADALARERLALEAEVAQRERELRVQTGEADSLQSELDTLTATLKQLENQKGQAQERLNDLKSQVEKLRSQAAAQEAAASETEAEVITRRAAAQSLKERERALQADAASAQAEADELTQRLSKTVLAVSQANIKISHLEEQLNLMESAASALAAGGVAAQQHLTLKPQFAPAILARLVRGATPNDLDDDTPFDDGDAFAAVNGGSGFATDPFAGAHPADPFAPAHNNQSGFESDPFAKAFPANTADPFAGDAFAATNNEHTNDNSGAWESDPFAVLHAPTRATAGGAGAATAGGGASPAPSLPPKKHKTPPPRPAPPRPMPPHKSERTMDFTEDPFKDYRYEDPFNIEDPFADVTDSKRHEPFGRPTSVAGFETDDFFSSSSNTVNGSFAQEKRSGRVSAPPDPFSHRSEFKPALSTVPSNNNDLWAAWPNDSWAAEDAWNKPKPDKSDVWSTNNSSSDWTADTWGGKPDNSWSNKTENSWGSKTENNWATQWTASTGTDHNKNLNDTWPSNTLPSKKEKSPKPVKYAKSLVHTIGGIGRTRHNKEKKDKNKGLSPVEPRPDVPSEEQQWAWAAAESKRLEAETEARRRQEDAELQLALALSRQEK